MKLFDTARYLEVAFVTRLIWSTHVNQARREEAKRLGMLGTLLNIKWLSIRNWVLPYKQLIRPMLESACPVWRSADRSLTRECRYCCQYTLVHW
jgi:hypothetical protein